MVRNPNWSEKELTLALALYYRIPATKISGTNPQIIEASGVIGRTPAAVSFKLANFRAIDENAGEGPKGLSHGSKKDLEVMKKFLDPCSKSADLSKLTDAVFSICQDDVLKTSEILGQTRASAETEDDSVLQSFKLTDTEKMVLVKQRNYQGYFRSSVLSNCGNQCLISRCQIPDLLEAAHIVSWSESVQTRLSIGNGIALNPFFHKAYDRNLMGISPDGTVEFADVFKKESKEFWDSYLSDFEGRKIDLNTRTPINKDFLSQHYSEFRASRFDVGFGS